MKKSLLFMLLLLIACSPMGAQTMHKMQKAPGQTIRVIDAKNYKAKRVPAAAIKIQMDDTLSARPLGITMPTVVSAVPSDEAYQPINDTLGSSVPDTIRVLAIGNSFSVNAVETHLAPLGREANVVFIIGNLYIGSCSLRMHALNIRTAAPKYSYRTIRDGHRTVHEGTSLQTALQDEHWDYISMQQVSNTCGMINSYDPWLTELIDSVRHYMKPDCQLL